MIALSASMKTVIIISKCTKVIKLKSGESWYEFHFKGVCAGEVLHKILLRTKPGPELRLNEEYIIYTSLHSISNGVLRGEIIKFKLLSECWDRS